MFSHFALCKQKQPTKKSSIKKLKPPNNMKKRGQYFRYTPGEVTPQVLKLVKK